MSKGKNLTTVAPGVAPSHGQRAEFPAEGGGNLSIFKLKSSPNYYGGWTNTIVGSLRQTTLGTADYETAKSTLFRLFGEARCGKKLNEVKFRDLAKAYLAAKGAAHEDNRLLAKALLPAFADYPQSAMTGKAGTTALATWNADHTTKAREANPAYDGREVFYRMSRCVRAVLKHAGIGRDDLPFLPKRIKHRRAELRENKGEFEIIAAHLRRRISAFRVGTAQHAARLALAQYFEFLTCFTGRTGTEALSATFEGVDTVTIPSTGKTWVTLNVNGKLGPAIRYADLRVRDIIAEIKTTHPTGTGLIFVTPAGTPRAEMHKLFRTAMLELETERGEPGHWTARFVDNQSVEGGVSLYSVRHGKLTALGREMSSENFVKAFGTSRIQYDQHYDHTTAEDALANL